jgi:hypothetical protein
MKDMKEKTKKICAIALLTIFAFAATATGAAAAGTNDSGHILSTAAIDFTVDLGEIEDIQAVQNGMSNAKLAAQKINGTVLHPGETFSFNETVGPRTKVYGYLLGRDSWGNLDRGSGICREATVVFQAARSAGMEIIERHSHYPNVDYASPGNDAAIWWGVKDLKFKNTLDYAVEIRTAVVDADMENHYCIWTTISKRLPYILVKADRDGGTLPIFNGIGMDKKIFVMLREMAEVYNSQYTINANFGVINAKIDGVEFTEVNDTLWYLNGYLYACIEKWKDNFGLWPEEEAYDFIY